MEECTKWDCQQQEYLETHTPAPDNRQHHLICHWHFTTSIACLYLEQPRTLPVLCAMYLYKDTTFHTLPVQFFITVFILWCRFGEHEFGCEWNSLLWQPYADYHIPGWRLSQRGTVIKTKEGACYPLPPSSPCSHFKPLTKNTAAVFF